MLCTHGQIYKPLTFPYRSKKYFEVGDEGLKILEQIKKNFDVLIVSEVMEVDKLELMKDFVDVFQIGARNMQNFKLLEAVGESKLPVLLKRGMSATLDELLLASEYILSRGNENVMLCERGIRTYETATRNTFDINAIPFLKQNSHLPVIADPSHATGDNTLVEPVALAAIAAGADG